VALLATIESFWSLRLASGVSFIRLICRARGRHRSRALGRLAKGGGSVPVGRIESVWGIQLDQIISLKPRAKCPIGAAAQLTAKVMFCFFSIVIA